MNALAARTHIDITVVWDGIQDPTASRVPHRHGPQPGAATIRFSPPGRTADDSIIIDCDTLPTTRQIVVVTADRNLRLRAARRGANTIKPEHLARAAAQHPHRTNRRPTPPHRRHPKPRHPMSEQPTPDSVDTDVLLVAQTEDGRWTLARVKHNALDQRLSAALADNSTETLSTHRTQRRAVRKARHTARRTDDGARILTHEPESMSRILVEDDLRSPWMWALIMFGAFGWAAATPDTPQNPNVLAAIGGAFMALAVTGLMQAVFGAHQPARSNLYRKILIRLIALGGAGGVLTIWALIFRSDAAQPLMIRASTGFLVFLGVVVLLSLMFGVCEYALADAKASRHASDTPTEPVAGQHHLIGATQNPDIHERAAHTRDGRHRRQRRYRHGQNTHPRHHQQRHPTSTADSRQQRQVHMGPDPRHTPTEDQPHHTNQLSLHATRLGALLAAHREARRIDGGAKIITEITPPKNPTRRCMPALGETTWRRTWPLVALFAVALVTTTASEIWRYPAALGILGGTLTTFAALGLAAAAFTSRSRTTITASDLYHRLIVRLVALTTPGERC